MRTERSTTELHPQCYLVAARKTNRFGTQPAGIFSSCFSSVNIIQFCVHNGIKNGQIVTTSTTNLGWIPFWITLCHWYVETSVCLDSKNGESVQFEPRDHQFFLVSF